MRPTVWFLGRSGATAKSIQERARRQLSYSRPAFVDGPVTPTEFVKANRERLMKTNECSPNEKAALQKIPFDECSPDGLYRSAQHLENVVGFLSLPVAMVGPLMVNGRTCHIPLATSDANIIAKTARGCKALEAAGGIQTRVIKDGIVQRPVTVLSSVFEAAAFAKFVEDPIRAEDLSTWFAETSGASKLTAVKCQVIGRRVMLRFSATCGDSTGADTVTKGIERVLQHFSEEWTGSPFEIVKGSVDTVEECGKTVAAEVVLPNDIIESILRTDPASLLLLGEERQALRPHVSLDTTARRVATSVLLATGQDIVPRAEKGSTLETTFEPVKSCMDPNVIVGVRIACTMDSIDVGTSGVSNARFAAQQACLNMLGVAGSNIMSPGENAQRLAEIVMAAVLATEVGSTAKFTTTTEELVKYSQQQFKTTAKPVSSHGRSRVPPKRTSMQSPPVPEAARGVSSVKVTVKGEPKNLINAAATVKSHPAYLELVAGRCAAEFGWADPRLTVP